MPDAQNTDINIFTRKTRPGEPCGKHVDVGVGIVVRPAPDRGPAGLGTNTPFLITRRRSETVYGGWWEFPGGKVEAGETPAQSVVRELYEETGVRARPLAALRVHRHVYEHARVALHPFVCELEPGSPEPRALEVAALEWITLAGLDRAAFLPANGPVLDALAEHLSRDPSADAPAPAGS